MLAEPLPAVRDGSYAMSRLGRASVTADRRRTFKFFKTLKVRISSKPRPSDRNSALNPASIMARSSVLGSKNEMWIFGTTQRHVSTWRAWVGAFPLVTNSSPTGRSNVRSSCSSATGPYVFSSTSIAVTPPLSQSTPPARPARIPVCHIGGTTCDRAVLVATASTSSCCRRYARVRGYRSRNRASRDWRADRPRGARPRQCPSIHTVERSCPDARARSCSPGAGSAPRPAS